MSRVAVLVSAIALFVSGFAPQTVDGSDSQSPVLSRVFSAWKARQERIKTFHFVWDTRFTLPKGAFRFPHKRGLATARNPGDFDGSQHLEFTFPQTEWWGEAADRLRGDFGRFVFDNAQGWKQVSRCRITHDGPLNSRAEMPIDSTQPRFSMWRQVPIPNLSSWLTQGSLLLEDRELELNPLRFAVRPLSLISPRSRQCCRVVSEDARLGDVKCL
jgi:hypothetical protein